MANTDRAQQVKDRRVVRTLSVKAAKNITPNMRRITLQGDELEGFPENAEGAYIKLLFDQEGSVKPILRTYTVSQQRSGENEIDVDFMLHVDQSNSACGIAAPWSIAANIGDQMSITGPGPAKFINTEADCFLLAADMTALPALTANLQLLPENATGKVFIEIYAEEDKQDLAFPKNIEIQWVINNDPGSDESPLYHAMAESKKLEGTLAAWVACEFKTMKKIRQYLKDECNIDKTRLYISSYWKRGDNEEAHKIVKRADSERNEI